jgi:hypothetical protein
MVVPEKKVCQLFNFGSQTWLFVVSLKEMDTACASGWVVKAKAVHSCMRSWMTPDLSDQVVQECNNCEFKGTRV